MDPFIISAITFLTMALGAWAGFVVLVLGGILYTAKKERGSVRMTDKALFVGTIIMTIAAFVVVFIWPGLIYMIPATVAFVEIASIPILGYLSEIAFKHYRRLRGKCGEVDEAA